MKTTKEKIEVMQAFDDGKKIEVRAGQWEKWQPFMIKGYPSWNWEHYDYRIAHEPKLRPWNSLIEVPRGAFFRFNTNQNVFFRIERAYPTGLRLNNADWTWKELLEMFSATTDHGKTWQPCGVME